MKRWELGFYFVEGSDYFFGSVMDARREFPGIRFPSDIYDDEHEEEYDMRERDKIIHDEQTFFEIEADVTEELIRGCSGHFKGVHVITAFYVGTAGFVEHVKYLTDDHYAAECGAYAISKDFTSKGIPNLVFADTQPMMGGLADHRRMEQIMTKKEG